jgi:hypothetical protein
MGWQNVSRLEDTGIEIGILSKNRRRRHLAWKVQQDISVENARSELLTHALCPESDELWLGRGPSTGQHSVQGAGEALDDTVASDTGRHRTKGARRERNCRKVTDGDNRGN